MHIDLTIHGDGKFYRLMTTVPTPPGHEVQPIWFENEDGEGMSMSENTFFEILDKAFKENF